jgi:PEP-CTERM motif
MNLALYQTLSGAFFSFLVQPPADSYSGNYSAILGAGSFSGSFHSVPEPSALLLLGAGLAGLVEWRRKQAA